MAAIAVFAGPALGNACARVDVAGGAGPFGAATFIGAEIRLRPHALHAGRAGTGVRELAVRLHRIRRTGCSLRAGKVEARAGDGNANRSPEYALERRAPRRSRRERPGQGVELLFIHRPITPFRLPIETEIKAFPHWKGDVGSRTSLSS